MSLWSWFRRRKPQSSRTRRPRPPEWSKTIDDLMTEKRTIPSEELEWARSYERDQLRTWVRFPKDGEEYEAERDIEVNYVVHWQAPFTGGGVGRMDKGTRIRVSVGAQDPEPIGVYASPLDKRRLEEHLVPESERSSPKYGGFTLFIPVGQLNKDFKRVSNK
jgi:hypothetical protein